MVTYICDPVTEVEDTRRSKPGRDPVSKEKEEEGGGRRRKRRRRK